MTDQTQTATDPRQAFAGATDIATALPSWYDAQTDAPSLQTVLQTLPDAVGRPLAYQDEQTGDWVEDSRFRVLVNPDWEGETGDDRPDDWPTTAAWYPVTTAYDPVTPTDAYQPLVDALAGADGETFGQVRTYRNGGEVHMDVFNTAYTVSLPDGADTDLNGSDGDQTTLDGDTTESRDWVLGLQTGHDYFTQTALYATVIAIDPATGAVHRHLADRRSRTHRKSRDDDQGETADELARWWDEELSRMDDVGAAILGVVYDATCYDVDLKQLPFDATDFMAAGGFPDSLADLAAERLPGKGAQDRYSAWAFHVAMMDALTHGFDGKADGSAERGHVRLANRWLFAPTNAEHDALEALAEQTRSQTGLSEFEDGTQADPFAVRKELRDRRDSLADKVDTHQSMAARLRAMLAAADETDDDQDATDGETDQTLTQTTA